MKSLQPLPLCQVYLVQQTVETSKLPPLQPHSVAEVPEAEHLYGAARASDGGHREVVAEALCAYLCARRYIYERFDIAHCGQVVWQEW